MLPGVEIGVALHEYAEEDLRCHRIVSGGAEALRGEPHEDGISAAAESLDEVSHGRLITTGREPSRRRPPVSEVPRAVPQDLEEDREFRNLVHARFAARTKIKAHPGGWVFEIIFYLMESFME